MNDNNESIYGETLTSDAKKQVLQDIYADWNVKNNLNNQTIRAFHGLTRLMQVIDAAVISSEVIEDKERIQEYQELFNKVAYMTDKFVSEFKPKYEKMSHLYLTEKIAGTFEPVKNEHDAREPLVGYSKVDSTESEDKNSW